MNGSKEVGRIVDSIKSLIKGSFQNKADTRRQIWSKKPHMTWDNYFSSDKIIDYVGQKCFGN